MWKIFYWRWFKLLWIKPAWADALSAIAGCGLATLGHFWPKTMILQNAWMIPIAGFALVGFVRLVLAPYELWKRAIEKSAHPIVNYEQSLEKARMEKRIKLQLEQDNSENFLKLISRLIRPHDPS